MNYQAEYEALIERATSLVPGLPSPDQEVGRRLLSLCAAVAKRPPPSAPGAAPSSDELDLKRELGRCTELMGRRSTRSLPLAALGRAALAHLGDDQRSLDEFLADCDRKLALLGL